MAKSSRRISIRIGAMSMMRSDEIAFGNQLNDIQALSGTVVKLKREFIRHVTELLLRVLLDQSAEL